MKRSRLMRHALRGALMTVVVSVFPLRSLHAATFEGIGDLPGGLSQSIVAAVSGDGTTVVGSSWDSSGVKPIRWNDDDRGIVAIAEGSFMFAGAGAVSSDASVIGVRLDNGSFLWTEETGLMNHAVNAGALSADGSTAVGATRFGTGAQAALWTSSKGARTLGRLSSQHNLAFATDVSADGSVVTGQSCGPCEAFRWTEETGMVGLGDLTGGAVSDSRAYGISADGNVIVGSATLPNLGTNQAFRWTAEEDVQGLGTVGAVLSSSQANAANADGSVVVGLIAADLFAPCSSGSCEPFYWDGDHGMRRLEDVLWEDYDLGSALAGWTLTSAVDISDDGLTIVGNGINPLGLREGWIARLDPPPLAGDYNGNGAVEQADLDLVLLNWGVTSPDAPEDWINDLPTGTIDQEELDGVLLNWGNTSASLAAAGVPEPATVGLLLLALAGVTVLLRRRS